MKSWFTNDVKFHNYASGFQSLAVAFGVLIGGVWTFFVFNATLHVQNAKAQLEKINRELQEQAKLEVTVDVEHIEKNEGLWYVVGEVQIANRGNRGTYLQVTDRTLTLSRAKLSPLQGTVLLEETRPILMYIAPPVEEGKMGMALGRHFSLPGRTVRYPFAVPVANVGLYLIQFQATVAEEDLVGLPQVRGDTRPAAWIAGKYLWVGSTSSGVK